jgi:hypothetical protein
MLLGIDIPYRADSWRQKNIALVAGYMGFVKLADAPLKYKLPKCPASLDRVRSIFSEITTLFWMVEKLLDNAQVQALGVSDVPLWSTLTFPSSPESYRQKGTSTRTLLCNFEISTKLLELRTMRPQ